VRGDCQRRPSQFWWNKGAVAGDHPWSSLVSRYETWWQRKNQTPLVQTWLPCAKELPPAAWCPQTESDWMDLKARVDWFGQIVESTPLAADSFHLFDVNFGPDILSVCYGSKIEFGEGTGTSWVHPIVGSCREVLDLEFSLQAPLWQRHLELQALSLERSQGRWLTGYADLHPSADLLVSLMGPETLAMEVVDDPEGFDLALTKVAGEFEAAYLCSIAQLQAAGQPTLNWMKTPVAGRHHVPSCDFSGLVSGEVFREFILPRVQAECQMMDRCIYHLDGPIALRHLEAVLEIPEIHAIQWVYGAGQEPARKWTEVYQKIQAAGKGMMIHCVDQEDALEVSKALHPEGCLYTVGGISEAEEAMALIHRLA